MPKLSKKRSKGQIAVTRRWSSVQVSSSSKSSNEEYAMDVDDKELSFNDKIFLTDIGDLAEMCKLKGDSKIPQHSHLYVVTFFQY